MKRSFAARLGALVPGLLLVLGTSEALAVTPEIEGKFTPGTEF